MKFKNPVNGYEESKSNPVLWAAIFGGMYYAANGLWAMVVFYFAAVAVALFAFEPNEAFVLMILIQGVFAGMAPQMVRKSYMVRGWTETA